MLKEFKEFAMRGNVMDMAIGIIIGTAFGKIISSFVSDVLMPLIGLLLGGIDFSNLAIVLKESVNENTPAVLLKYGLFINTIIDFLIIAFAIFLVIKSLNAMKKKEEEAPSEPPKPSEEVELLRQIRDSLKK
jgi:large conductance mechanosensitive channel